MKKKLATGIVDYIVLCVSLNTFVAFQFTSLQKEIDDHKEEIKKYQAETAKLNNVIRNLEKDIASLKKEIQERDETIQDKVSLPWSVPFYDMA